MSIQLVETPAVGPGCCCYCGGFDVSETQWLDLQKEIQWYGRLYLCSVCVDLCGEVLGYITQSNANDAVAGLEAAQAEIAELKDKNETLLAAIQASGVLEAFAATVEEPAPPAPAVESAPPVITLALKEEPVVETPVKDTPVVVDDVDATPPAPKPRKKAAPKKPAPKKD